MNIAIASPPGSMDPGVRAVASCFTARAGMERLFADCFRQAIDEVLDGQRTGRYDLTAADVESTEKTYLGTKVEIIVRAAFSLLRGRYMDYLVDGHEVDAKFTMRKNWSIPAEAVGHICLLMTADDAASFFRVGLVRITESALNQGRNRDGKRTLSKHGRESTFWIVPDGRLTENLLLHLPAADREKIFSHPGGQTRINELFRRVHGRIVNRSTVLTVAKQDDSPKRVRDARLRLRAQGIIILGHQRGHQRIAGELGLPVPTRGEWVAARVTPASYGFGGRVAFIGEIPYRTAAPEDAETEAPKVTE
ncbi:NaeI family type II restriction endonuclease [Streptomyces johnsoniae]|uniref:NaeI family type II restriction endonuclease n=1 Tax=Streptomyces johnsoniae TaxID=3075532 RepID=A0ABU2SE94_9ACTN|nr:NaeI family type II restriction endonuclease [Streptomyces sp. DSM 41886]MDT0447296.1 NaeI family type II restriction endonuclease [Streptomyces sp. DSM 41886]